MTFPAYPAYKDSGMAWLGAIPEHWILYRSKNVFAERNIKALESDEQLTASQKYGVIPQKLFSELEDQKVMQVILGRDILKKAEVNDFVISMRSFQGGLEFSSYSGAVSSAYVPLYANREIEHKFFKFLFKSGPFIAALQNTSNLVRDGQALRYNNFVQLSLPFPSINEQKAIGSFLDHETARIDALIEEQQLLIELLKEKRQAVISHAVTKGLDPTVPMKDSGVEWLGEVPVHWDVVCVKHIKSWRPNAFVDGPFGSNLKSEHFVDDGGVYVIESNFATTGELSFSDLKQITPNHFETIRRSEVCAGDIVIAKIGARYGMCSILPWLDKPAVVSGNSLKLTVNEEVCDSRFAVFVLKHLKERGAIEDIVNMTAQPALSLGEMNNLPFPLPPLCDQLSIVSDLEIRLGEFEALTSECRQVMSLATERRSALISAAVTGKIDVRGWQPPASTQAPVLELEAV